MAHALKILVDQMKAVSHPLRLRVLALLEAGELCVCQVAATLQVPQSSVSEALRELRRVGFVAERKEGRWVFVSVVQDQASSPLLKGILAGAVALPEVHQDRARAREVKLLTISAVCSRIQDRAPQVREGARV
jgi:ArsR family transcriptional regulator